MNQLDGSLLFQETLGNLRKNSKKNKYLCNIFETYPHLLQLISDSYKYRRFGNDFCDGDEVKLKDVRKFPLVLAESIYNNGIFNYFKKFQTTPPWLFCNFKFANFGFGNLIAKENNCLFYIVLRDDENVSVYNFQFMTTNRLVTLHQDNSPDGIYYSIDGKNLKLFVPFTSTGHLKISELQLEDFEYKNKEDDCCDKNKIKVSVFGLWISKKLEPKNGDGEISDLPVESETDFYPMENVLDSVDLTEQGVKKQDLLQQQNQMELDLSIASIIEGNIPENEDPVAIENIKKELTGEKRKRVRKPREDKKRRKISEEEKKPEPKYAEEMSKFILDSLLPKE